MRTGPRDCVSLVNATMSQNKIVASTCTGCIFPPSASSTLATFSDSGAHVCQEMGSSLQTHLLSYWVREKQVFTLEEAVRMLTFDNASAFEIPDRGLLRTGYAADLVLFDEEQVRPRLPTVEHDLPGGVRRLVQKAEGIAATIVNGEVAFEDGNATGALSGQVLKGAEAIRH